MVPPGDALVAASLAAQDAKPGERFDSNDLVTQLLGDRFADLAACLPDPY